MIRRRLLVNLRADAAVVAGILPPPFRPKLHDGWAIVGICLIRLEEIRPKGTSASSAARQRHCRQRPFFASLEAASGFFEPGSVGFSATASGRRLDQVVLTTQAGA